MKVMRGKIYLMCGTKRDRSISMIDINLSSPEEKPRCIVRLSTSEWSDRKGIYIKRSLVFLQRKCVGYNILKEDASCIGASEVFPRIDNLNECEDGIYKVITINEKWDWETNTVDDFDYKLVPYEK